MDIDNIRVNLDYLNNCSFKLKEISESNEMLHDKFSNFFNSADNCSFSCDFSETLLEECKYQQGIFYNQTNLVEDLDNEIRLSRIDLTEKLEKAKEAELEDGWNDSDK